MKRKPMHKNSIKELHTLMLQGKKGVWMKYQMLQNLKIPFWRDQNYEYPIMKRVVMVGQSMRDLTRGAIMPQE
jgi:hypothetical protein